MEIYKSLMALKKTEAGVDGSLIIQALNDEVLLIRRDLSDTTKKSLMAIFNFGAQYASLSFINATNFPKAIDVNVSRLISFHDIG